MRIFKKRCRNCGKPLELSEKYHYIAVENKGLSSCFRGVTRFDAYDCAVCGRQYLAGVRADKEADNNDEAEKGD